MSLVRAAFSRGEHRGADPLLPWGSSYIPQNGELARPAAGVPMNDDAALSVSTVYTSVSILADSVATMPLHAYKMRSSGKMIDPQPPLVCDPWPEGTVQDWLTQVMVSLTLRGNFYGLITDRDDRGYATTIMPLHPDRVMARRDERTGERCYYVMGKQVPTTMVVHIPAILTPGNFVGLNPVEYMRQSWGLAKAAEMYGGQFFANSANPSGIIEVEEDLNEEETLELARSWKMSHGGLGNAQYPAVLTGGATWKQLSINPDDAQFLATRQFQQQEIAGFFRIPVHMLGIQDRTSSWGTGIEQMYIGFVLDTLTPWMARIESYLTKLLPKNQVAKFDLKRRLRGDSFQRAQANQIMRNGGAITANEWRVSEDMAPIDDPAADVLLQPMNMVPLGTDPATYAKGAKGKKPDPVDASGVGQDGTGGSVGGP